MQTNYCPYRAHNLRKESEKIKIEQTVQQTNNYNCEEAQKGAEVMVPMRLTLKSTMEGEGENKKHTEADINRGDKQLFRQWGHHEVTRSLVGSKDTLCKSLG